jgi:hypothetical protein
VGTLGKLLKPCINLGQIVRYGSVSEAGVEIQISPYLVKIGQERSTVIPQFLQRFSISQSD